MTASRCATMLWEHGGRSTTCSGSDIFQQDGVAHDMYHRSRKVMEIEPRSVVVVRWWRMGGWVVTVGRRAGGWDGVCGPGHDQLKTVFNVGTSGLSIGRCGCPSFWKPSMEPRQESARDLSRCRLLWLGQLAVGGWMDE